MEVIIDLLFAIVHPLKDINLMTPCYIIQVIFFSWTATAGFAVLQISLRVSLKTRDLSRHCPFLLAGCNFTRVPPIYADSILYQWYFVTVYKHYRSARTLLKQLRYNHHWVSLKTYHGEKSAVIMMGIVIGVFIITYGMYLHCSF